MCSLETQRNDTGLSLNINPPRNNSSPLPLPLPSSPALECPAPGLCRADNPTDWMMTRQQSTWRLWMYTGDWKLDEQLS
ncbi:hypothetical protein B9Z55_009717 [Caenorhabditis nigoni]|uniref:Uncharacterized protein n=1 Tax=Caenorhabditis nigoni TaxID=1611254 RepID=A0A2G5UT91_9PELO|nr:hypothetical protein B9Z55_009717 [Caenorhabditis nigoni]